MELLPWLRAEAAGGTNVHALIGLDSWLWLRTRLVWVWLRIRWRCFAVSTSLLTKDTPLAAEQGHQRAQFLLLSW